MTEEHTLARRLGVTTHISPLRIRLGRLFQEYPSPGGDLLEDWLLDVANARGAAVVQRVGAPATAAGFRGPPASELTDEELVAALCQTNNLDRPWLLRPAAQLVSRGNLALDNLFAVARRERVGRILAELARQALRVDPEHPAWRAIDDAFRAERPLRDTLAHWTRLAEPIMRPGRPGPAGWRLVR